ncbi:14274_t:CDS:2 [Acaulospora colombiana]|uniref:14274_t:CDS:1 n=1 Tax=Acaulospora colombiana TaxID=27376 RepID=A0ACA9KL93_9GLOM|nr:14274_t:CDS:2 [Acaulospora colombiana]
MIFGLCYSVLGQESKPVPLKNVVVEANVVDMIAEVAISQTYINVEENSIEAIYRFPIHEAAAVCSFEVEIDGRRKIKGVVKESGKATQEYNDAVQQGHGAYLLEEHYPDVFECKVGNITHKQKVVIKITYVTELKHDSETEKIRFELPTHIAPRYQPPDSSVGFEADKHYSVGIGDGFDLSISVTCRMTSVITCIESPSHHISTELNIDGNPKVSRITFEENAKYLEKDFVLVVKSQGLDRPSQPYSQSSQSAAVNLAQHMLANMSGTEIYRCLEWVFANTRSDMPTAIFLLTDGSVWNVDEIAELVRKNMKLHKDNLRVFTLGIGDSVSHNLVESVARAGKGYSQYVTNNERMDKKVIGMLKNAVKPPIKDYKITWSDADLMEVEIIPEKEKPVISFFSDNDIPPPPPLPDDFVERLQLRQAPHEIPQIYQGVRFLVYCMFAKGVEPSRTITLTATSQDGPMRLEIPVDPVTLQGSKIHTLAARKLIQDLEDGKSFLHLHPKFEGKNVGVSSVKKQIIDLSVNFLAIDDRDVEMDKDKIKSPQQRVIPPLFMDHRSASQNNFRSNFGGASKRRKAGLSLRSSASSPVARSMMVATASTPVGSAEKSKKQYRPPNSIGSLLSSDRHAASISSYTSLASNALSECEVAICPSLSPAVGTTSTYEDVKRSGNPTVPDSDLLYEFLRLQSFDGKFLPGEEFYSYFNLGGKDDAGNGLREFGIKNGIEETVWTTAVAIKYLEIVMGEKYLAESEMCREKAENALKKMTGEGERENKVLEVAQRWINEWHLMGKDK